MIWVKMGIVMEMKKSNQVLTTWEEWVAWAPAVWMKMVVACRAWMSLIMMVKMKAHNMTGKKKVMKMTTVKNHSNKATPIHIQNKAKEAKEDWNKDLNKLKRT